MGDKITLVKLHSGKFDLLKFCARTGDCHFCPLIRSDFGDGLIFPQTQKYVIECTEQSMGVL